MKILIENNPPLSPRQAPIHPLPLGEGRGEGFRGFGFWAALLLLLSLLTSQATLTNSVVIAISGNSTTWALLSSPYLHGNNTVPEVLANTPWIGHGTAVYVLDSTGTNYLSSSYSTNAGWSDPTLVIGPGIGFFISFDSYKASQHAATYTVTFSGENFSAVSLPANGIKKQVGAPLARAGTLVSGLNFPVRNGDLISKYSIAAQAYTSDFYTDDAWDSGTQPTLYFGEGILVQRGTNTAGASWSRP